MNARAHTNTKWSSKTKNTKTEVVKPLFKLFTKLDTSTLAKSYWSWPCRWPFVSGSHRINDWTFITNNQNRFNHDHDGGQTRRMHPSIQGVEREFRPMVVVVLKLSKDYDAIAELSMEETCVVQCSWDNCPPNVGNIIAVQVQTKR